MNWTYDWGDVPLAIGSLLQTNTEEDQANHGEDKSNVRKPESVLRSRTSAKLLGALVHPEIADPATNLFANDETDHDAEELKTELLGVQAELGKEELRNFDSKENAAEPEDNRVCDCGNPYGGIAEEEHRLDELNELEGLRVDTLEVEVFLLEGRNVVADDITHVKSFRAEEEVSDELHTIGLSFVSFALLLRVVNDLRLQGSSIPSGSCRCDR